MTLYDIDESIAALIDPDTGEITDYAALDALQMERSEKVGQIAELTETPLQRLPPSAQRLTA